jgi:hypothetical protein
MGPRPRRGFRYLSPGFHPTAMTLSAQRITVTSLDTSNTAPSRRRFRCLTQAGTPACAALACAQDPGAILNAAPPLARGATVESRAHVNALAAAIGARLTLQPRIYWRHAAPILPAPITATSPSLVPGVIFS